MKWYYVVGLVLCINFLFQHKEDKSHIISDIIYLRDEINALEERFNKEIKAIRK